MQRLLCFFLLFSVASCGEWYECGMEWRPCEDIYANAEQRYVARRRGEEAQKIERVLPTRNRNKISIDVHCTAHSMRLCCLCVSCTLFLCWVCGVWRCVEIARGGGRSMSCVSVFCLLVEHDFQARQVLHTCCGVRRCRRPLHSLGHFRKWSCF